MPYWVCGRCHHEWEATAKRKCDWCGFEHPLVLEEKTPVENFIERFSSQKRKVIGIIGTRKRDDKKTFDLIEKKFLEIYKEGDWICSGGCKQGGDRCADYLAEKYGAPMLTFYPNKRKYGIPRAYFMRNTEIARESDVIIASVMKKDIEYIRKSKSGGTEDTIKKYLKFKKNLVYLV